jgi:hypothetical protein
LTSLDFQHPNLIMDISIQNDLKKLRQSLTALEKRAVPQATVRTLNRTAETVKTASVRHISPQLGSKQAGIKRRIETRKASLQKLWSVLVASGRQLQLIEFVVGSKKPTRKGGKRGLVRTRVFGKQKTYQKAFIAPKRKGDSKTTLYVRKGKARKPVRMMFDPGIKEFFKQKDNDSLMQAKAKEVFPVEFLRNLAYYVTKLKR